MWQAHPYFYSTQLMNARERHSGWGDGSLHHVRAVLPEIDAFHEVVPWLSWMLSFFSVYSVELEQEFEHVIIDWLFRLEFRRNVTATALCIKHGGKTLIIYSYCTRTCVGLWFWAGSNVNGPWNIAAKLCWWFIQASASERVCNCSLRTACFPPWSIINSKWTWRHVFLGGSQS